MRIFTALVLCIALFSCTSKKATPKDIIQMKPMQEIVWDMLQADELAFQRKVSDSTVNLQAVSFQLYDTVFAIHKVSRQNFYKSYEYYQRDPALFKQLMSGVRAIGDTARKAKPS